MSIESSIYGYIVNEETHPKGAAIIGEGSKGEWVYVILEGHVKLTKMNSKKTLVLSILKKDDVFGQIDFLKGGSGFRNISAVASGGPVRVGVLDTERLVRDYEAVPTQIRILIKSLMGKLKDIIEKTSYMVTE
ncbi:MAG: cyclic nucleotide-binding domain-containing protein [Thermodesulfobacteriota bacterium]|nr:cyclic nucleotide-binding domain-containing protein [Thermodesulfobacteriota bacterium]